MILSDLTRYTFLLAGALAVIGIELQLAAQMVDVAFDIVIELAAVLP